MLGKKFYRHLELTPCLLLDCGSLSPPAGSVNASNERRMTSRLSGVNDEAILHT